MNVCLHTCLCTTGVLGALGGQKKASGPLKLEVQMVSSHHVGAGNEVWTLCKKTNILSPQVISLGPQYSVILSIPPPPHIPFHSRYSLYNSLLPCGAAGVGVQDLSLEHVQPMEGCISLSSHHQLLLAPPLKGKAL